MDKSVEKAQTRKAPKGGGRVPPKSVSAALTPHEGYVLCVLAGQRLPGMVYAAGRLIMGQSSEKCCRPL